MSSIKQLINQLLETCKDSKSKNEKLTDIINECQEQKKTVKAERHRQLTDVKYYDSKDKKVYKVTFTTIEAVNEFIEEQKKKLKPLSWITSHKLKEWNERVLGTYPYTDQYVCNNDGSWTKLPLLVNLEDYLKKQQTIKKQ